MFEEGRCGMNSVCKSLISHTLIWSLTWTWISAGISIFSINDLASTRCRVAEHGRESAANDRSTGWSFCARFWDWQTTKTWQKSLKWCQQDHSFSQMSLNETVLMAMLQGWTWPNKTQSDWFWLGRPPRKPTERILYIESQENHWTSTMPKRHCPPALDLDIPDVFQSDLLRFGLWKVGFFFFVCWWFKNPKQPADMYKTR